MGVSSINTFDFSFRPFDVVAGLFTLSPLPPQRVTSSRDSYTPLFSLVSKAPYTFNPFLSVEDPTRTHLTALLSNTVQPGEHKRESQIDASECPTSATFLCSILERLVVNCRSLISRESFFCYAKRLNEVLMHSPQ